MLGSSSTVKILNNYYNPNQKRIPLGGEDYYYLHRFKIKHQLLHKKKQLIAVTGKSGSGKTFACEEFLKQVSKTIDNVIYLYLKQNSDVASISLQSNLGYPLRELDSSLKTKIFEAFHNLGLSKLANSKALTTNIDDLSLSIGERQRVIVCRGVLSNADIIVYDEPLSSQDPINRDKILRLLGLESQRKKNIAIIITDDYDRLEGFDYIINITRD